jgi:hypothetical protein
LAPFGQTVSEEKIFLTLANQKQELPLAKYEKWLIYLDFYQYVSKYLIAVLLFSSPDPKGHVRYCHHLASVVRHPSVGSKEGIVFCVF